MLFFSLFRSNVSQSAWFWRSTSVIRMSSVTFTSGLHIFQVLMRCLTGTRVFNMFLALKFLSPGGAEYNSTAWKRLPGWKLLPRLLHCLLLGWFKSLCVVYFALEEKFAQAVCFLLVDLYLLTFQPEKALHLLAVLDKLSAHGNNKNSKGEVCTCTHMIIQICIERQVF